MGKYTITDVAKDTGVSSSDASAAHHQAREDARESGYIKEKDGSGGGKEGKFSKTDSSGKTSTGFFKSLFG